MRESSPWSKPWLYEHPAESPISRGLMRQGQAALGFVLMLSTLACLWGCGGRETPDDQGFHQDVVNGSSGAEVTFDATVLADPVESGGHERIEVTVATGE